jgi:hypothetical protein
MSATPTAGADVSLRVKQYRAIRDKIKEMDEAHDKAREPLVEVQNLLTGWLQECLEKAGADSIKTPDGTCYSSTRYTASLADPGAFMAFVKSTNNLDLLDRKANANAVRDYVAEKGTLPPGVNLSALKTIGVRKPGAAKEA